MRTRIEEIDTIRGYAIFGILVCNIFLFHHPIEYFSQFFFSDKSASGQFFNFIRFNYFGDRTYTVFSFLFGIGIGMQYLKFKERGESFTKYHTYRMLGLLLLGILHTTLLWYGDILTLYALLGICIIPLFGLSFRKTLAIAFVCLLMPTVQTILARNGIFELSFRRTEPQSLTAVINQNTNQGLIGHLKFNWYQISHVYEYYASGMVFTSVGMILIGFSLGQTKRFSKDVRNVKHHKKIVLICIPIVLVWSLYQLFIFNPEKLGTTFDFYLFWFLTSTSAFAQTFLVVSGCFLLYRRKFSSSMLITGFNKLGKLSLTNYVFHSLFGLIAFKIFGLFGQSTPSIDFCLAIVVTLIQMLVSDALLKRYGKGPLEIAWRKLTSFLVRL